MNVRKFKPISERIRKNPNAWFNYFRYSNACYQLESLLYSYSGDCNWLNAGNNSDSKENAINYNTIWNQYNNSFYPFNGFLGQVNNFYFRGNSTFLRLPTLLKHLSLNVYENPTKALFDNVISSIVSGEISANLQIYANDVLVSAIDAKLQEIEKLKEIQVEEAKYQIALKSQGAQIPEEAQQQIDGEIEKNVDLLHRNEVNELQFDKLAINKDDNLNDLLASVITKELNKFLECPENRASFNKIITQFCAGGFSVVGLFPSDDGFELIVPDRPDTCFFSPISKTPTKSDSKFCGEIRCYEKYNAMQKFNLTEEEFETLQHFELPMGSDSLTYWNTYNYDAKSFILLCHYYEKTKDGKKVRFIICDRYNILHEEILNMDFLPLIFIDSDDKDHRLNQSSIFSVLFPVQYKLNECNERVSALVKKLHGAKFVATNVTEDFEQKMLSNDTYLNSSFIRVTDETSDSQMGGISINSPSQFTIVPATDLPQTLLAEKDACIQSMHNMIFGIMQNNGMSKGGSSIISNVSGVAMERMDAKQSDLVRKYVNIVEYSLSILFTNVFIKNFETVYKKKNKVFQSLFKLLAERQASYKDMIENFRLQIEISINTEDKRSKNRQQLLDASALSSQLTHNPETLKQISCMLYEEYVNQTDLSNKGEIISKLRQISEEKEQPQQQSMTPFEEKSLQLKEYEINKNSEDKERKIQSDEKIEALNIQSTMLMKKMEQIAKTFDTLLAHPKSSEPETVRRDAEIAEELNNKIDENLFS